MAVLKLAKSKKSVLFFTDELSAYVVPVSVLLSWLSVPLESRDANRLVLLTKLPIPVTENRFQKSPVYGSDLAPSAKIATPDKDTYAWDGLGEKRIAKGESMVQYEDKSIW